MSRIYVASKIPLISEVDVYHRFVISRRQRYRHVPGLSMVGVEGVLVGVDTAVYAVVEAI